MMSLKIASLAKSLFRRFTKKTPSHKLNRFRPMLETFEDRTVPTAVVTVAAVADATEGGSAGTFRFSRTDTTGTLLVAYTVGGTATSGNDYTALFGTVLFASGAPTADVTVSSANDSTSEPTETVTATVYVYGGASYTAGSPDSATVNIFDNDAQYVSVESIANATEGGDNGTFEFTRLGDLSSSLTVNFSVGGTASSGTDYTSIGTSVTFAAGAATADVNVTALPGSLSDPNKTVDITIASDIGYSIGAGTAEMFIADNPPAGKVTEVLIDFSNLPAAGTGYTLKITVVGTTAGTTNTITVDNSMAVNSPEDTRNAVQKALRPDGQLGGWEVEAVGTTKLKIKRFYIPQYTDVNGNHASVSGEIDTIKIESKDLKDNQKPKYSVTRLAATDSNADRAVATTDGGSWSIGFETNSDASTLADDVVMTVTIYTASGSVPVSITLTSGMTPSDIASALADALGDEGFAFSASGSVATFDDGDETIEYIEVAYTSTGSNPAVDWLTETIGFTAY